MVAQNEHQEREALKFFRSLYGEAAPGYLPIWTRQDRITRWLPAADLESAARVVENLAQTRDVYFGLGLQPLDLGQNRRGEAKDVIAIPGLWADIDVHGPAHKGTDLPPTKDYAWTLLGEFPLDPTLVIDSGHGLQPWWLFKGSWVFDGDEEHRRAQDLIRRFQTALQARAASHGWRMDTTSDLARVMRPAGSTNHKLDDPVPVRIIELDEERRYSRGDFEPYLSNEVEMPYRHAEPVGGNIPEGRRNDTLFRLACSMRAQGFDEETILATILNINGAQCDPPLPENEVRRIARSAGKYDPGPSWATLRGLVTNEPPRPPILSAATTGGVTAESKLRFYTAKEIAEMAPEEPEWLVRQYVVKGAITDINGKAKAGGKTTFVTHLCGKVLDGERFMDLPTVKTAVMYLSEQSATTFREALSRADLLAREDLAVVLWRDTIGVNWPEIVREAAEEAVRRGAELLVVDTLPQFAGLEGDGENSAAAALAAMAPIQEAAATHDLAVILVRHERKSGGQVGDSGRGSSAFAGAVDIIVSIRRPEGAARPTIRELHALSRFDETPDVLVVELTESGYRALGDRAAVAEAEAREAVLEAAPTSEVAAASLDELLETTGVGRTTAQGAIKDLLETGELRRVGEGVRGDPRRYWHPSGRPGLETDLPSEEHTSPDHENGTGNHESAGGVPSTRGSREGQEGGTAVNTEHEGDGELTEMGKPKMSILEYGPNDPPPDERGGLGPEMRAAFPAPRPETAPNNGLEAAENGHGGTKGPLSGEVPHDGVQQGASPGAAPPDLDGDAQLVRTEADLQALAEELHSAERVGLDLETTGLDPREDRVRILSLTISQGSWLVDCSRVDPRSLFPILTEKELVIHNALFDLGFLFRMGFEPGENGGVLDTMLTSQLLEGLHPKDKEGQ